MKHESGAPAFENIDDLLAERIVSHSRRHSGRPKERRAAPPVKDNPSAEIPREENDEHSGTLFFTLALALLAFFFLLYCLLNRKPAR